MAKAKAAEWFYIGEVREYLRPVFGHLTNDVIRRLIAKGELRCLPNGEYERAWVRVDRGSVDALKARHMKQPRVRHRVGATYRKR